MADQVPNRIFWIFASFWGIAAVYHFMGVFGKVNEVPAWRHALFGGIDLLFAYGLLKRPRYFSWFFLLFLVQQYITHGSKLLTKWQQQATLDWISVLVLLVLPIVFFYLRKEEKYQRAAAAVSSGWAKPLKEGRQ